MDTRQPPGQEAYNHSNSQQYIEAGYNACTKAKHKAQLPTFWWCGAEQVDSHKY